jgi:hypothetical protein
MFSSLRQMAVRSGPMITPLKPGEPGERGELLYILSVVMVVVAGFFVALRIGTRLSNVGSKLQGLGADDYFVLASLVIATLSSNIH